MARWSSGKASDLHVYDQEVTRVFNLWSGRGCVTLRQRTRYCEFREGAYSILNALHTVTEASTARDGENCRLWQRMSVVRSKTIGHYQEYEERGNE